MFEIRENFFCFFDADKCHDPFPLSNIFPDIFPDHRNITLTVEDSMGLTGTDSKKIEVLTAPLAIELLIEKVNQSHVTRSIKRELVASLRVALNASKAEKIRQTQTALDAFEKKATAKLHANYPALERAWKKWSQSVSTGMEKCIKPPVKHKDHYDDKKGDRK